MKFEEMFIVCLTPQHSKVQGGMTSLHATSKMKVCTPNAASSLEREGIVASLIGFKISNTFTWELELVPYRIITPRDLSSDDAQII